MNTKTAAVKRSGLFASYLAESAACPKFLAFVIKKIYSWFKEMVQKNGRAGKTGIEEKMKITLQKISDGNEEVIIKYRQMTEQIERIVKYLEGQDEKLLGNKDGEQVLVSVNKVIYLESVDGITWFYTREEAYRCELTLAMWEMMYVKDGFFRCSKSMIINIYHIRRLKSLPGKRIDATMDNGEHVIISRHYSGELRSILRRDA